MNENYFEVQQWVWPSQVKQNELPDERPPYTMAFISGQWYFLWCLEYLWKFREKATEKYHIYAIIWFFLRTKSEWKSDCNEDASCTWITHSMDFWWAIWSFSYCETVFYRLWNGREGNGESIENCSIIHLRIFHLSSWFGLLSLRFSLISIRIL